MRFTKILAVLLLLIFITSSGCVKDTTQVCNGTIGNVTEKITVAEENGTTTEEKEMPEEIIPVKKETVSTPNVMGSFYTNGFVSLKVPTDGVRVVERVADFPTLIATSGNRYVEVQIEIRNDNKDEAIKINSSQFTLLDSEHHVNTIDANQPYLSKNLENITLPPLKKISGPLLFQVSTKRNVTELVYNGSGNPIAIEISLPKVVEEVTEKIVENVTEGLSATAIENGILRTSSYQNIQFDDGAIFRIISTNNERPDKGITRFTITLKVEHIKRAKLMGTDFAVLINGEIYSDVESIKYSEYDPKKEAVITIAIPRNLGDADFKGSKFAIKYGATTGAWII